MLRGKGHKNKENSSKEDMILDNILHIGNKTNPGNEAVRIAVIYILFGFAWVLLTDILAQILAKDENILVLLSTIKGWVYVILTGIIVYGLVLTTLRRIHLDENKLDQSFRELRCTYEEMEASHEELMASEEELRQQYDSLMESQQMLLKSEERYRLVSEATNDGIWDEQEDIRYFSGRWFEITGYSREELESIGNWKKLIHPEDYDMAMASLGEHLQNKTPYYRCEYRMMTKSGNYIWIQARGKALFDEMGHAYRVAGSHTDITQLKEYQSRLHHMAYHDYLTTLPNRQALYDHHERLASREGDHHFVLFFIDLDNFKLINDTMGHDFGDRLIKALSIRLSSLLMGEDKLYRIGGDEFVIIAYDIVRQENAQDYAAILLAVTKEPFRLGDSTMHINISIGYAMFPQHGKDINELLRCADIAMYKAKESGGNKHFMYCPSMNDVMLERMQIEKHLHMSMENSEFILHYQPQFDLVNNTITGFEALLRWNNPDLGSVPPLKFIHIAEETHYIIPLGAWVLREACAFAKRLQDQGRTDLTIAVNISILQILQEDFVDMVLEVLELYDLEPSILELEITESILMESYDLVISKLNRLNNKGIKIALDDFGKGYSSLSYLKQLPISTLKIDKSFIDYISTDEKSKPLTGQIVSMGKSMGLCVIAEGVETKEQFDYLSFNKCHKIQGFLFSKPLPESEAVKLLSQDKQTIF